MLWWFICKHEIIMGKALKTLLTITDVTRMGGKRVCVAGVDEFNKSIRPIINNGITEGWLCSNGLPIIRPFAKVFLNLISNEPDPPHTEDWIIAPGFKQPAGILDEPERKDFLDGICSRSVTNIFDAKIHQDPGYYVKHGEGKRSLGTIKIFRFMNFSHSMFDNKWDYRIHFLDSNNDTYKLKITDLSFRSFVDYMRTKKNVSPEKISEQLTKSLSTSTVYLRIGLARNWNKYPDCCFLQVTGVYTFPDYLDGRCFADFI